MLECVDHGFLVGEGGSIPQRGNRSGRARNARASDALGRMRVDMGEVTQLGAVFPADEEGNVRRMAHKDVHRGEDFGVCREHEYLRVKVAVLHGRFNELRRQLAPPAGALEDDVDVRRARSRLKESLFRSHGDPYFRGGPFLGRSQNR